MPTKGKRVNKKGTSARARRTKVTLLLDSDVVARLHEKSERKELEFDFLVNTVLRTYAYRRGRSGYMAERTRRLKARAEAERQPSEMPLFRRLRRESEYSE